MALSDKLYELRKKKGLSQEQLAEHLGVSRQAVSKWESGQSVPEYDKLIAVSRYYGISLDRLMKDEEDASENVGGAAVSEDPADALADSSARGSAAPGKTAPESVMSEGAVHGDGGSGAGKVREKGLVGLILCVGGALCMIMWGLVSVFDPHTSGQIGASSMVVIDGNGILLTLCVTAIIVGAVLLLKNRHEK